MRSVVQRVSQARVRIDDEITGEIGVGFVVLFAVRTGDTQADVRWMAEKVANLRIFPDDDGKMNRSLLDVGGAALVVSQFTLYGDCRKGRRPSFMESAGPSEAIPLYEAFLAELRSLGVPMETGRFAADMQVELTNVGPVTLVIDSPDTSESRK